MNLGKFLLGIISGAAAGAALGIYFAPEKSSVTRKQIPEKGEDYMDYINSRFQDFLITATNEIESIKSEAEKILNKRKVKV